MSVAADGDLLILARVTPLLSRTIRIERPVAAVDLCQLCSLSHIREQTCRRNLAEATTSARLSPGSAKTTPRAGDINYTTDGSDIPALTLVLLFAFMDTLWRSLTIVATHA